ncbi:aminotransferase class V-fold PLP-dependent enzyme, partial [Neisseria gonorrhoeae]
NIPGGNFVTSTLEHPSSFDAVSYYAKRLGKELRIAKSNPITGGIDVDEIVGLIDADTCFLSVMYASNISGAKIDIKT